MGHDGYEDHSSAFLNKVLPKRGEGLYSFLFRNARANYFRDLQEFVLCQTSRSSLYTHNFNYYNPKIPMFGEFKRILDSVNLDIQMFVLNQFDTILMPAKHSYVDHFRMYYNKRTKYCLHCIQEELHHQLIWDVAFVTVCLEHGVFLLEQCKNCSQPTTVYFLMRNMCKCGFVFDRASVTLQRPNPFEQRAQRIIQALLERQSHEVVQESGTTIDVQKYFQVLQILIKLLEILPGEHPIYQTSSFKAHKVSYRRKDKSNRCLPIYSILTTTAHNLLLDPSQIPNALYFSIGRLTKKEKHVLLNFLGNT